MDFEWTDEQLLARLEAQATAIRAGAITDDKVVQR